MHYKLDGNAESTMFRVVRFLPKICDIEKLCYFSLFVFEIFATVYFEVFIIWTF